MFFEYVSTHLNNPSSSIDDCQDIKMKGAWSAIKDFLLKGGFAQEPTDSKFFTLPLVKGDFLNLGLKEPCSQEENCRVYISVNYSSNQGKLLHYYTEQTEEEFLLVLEKRIKEAIDLYFYKANV